MILYSSLLVNVQMEGYLLSLSRGGRTGGLKEIKGCMRFMRIGRWPGKPQKLETNAEPGCNSTYTNH